MEIKIKHNLSRSYIIPLMARHLQFNNGFVLNSYLYDINRLQYNDNKIEGIFILIKWSNNPVHKLFENNLFDNPLVLDHYDINKDYYMIYSLFPSEVENDIIKLINGQYSKITEDAKKQIAKYWQLSTSAPVMKVLKKDPGYRKELENSLGVKLTHDAELSSIMLGLKGETFDTIIENKSITII